MISAAASGSAYLRTVTATPEFKADTRLLSRVHRMPCSANYFLCESSHTSEIYIFFFKFVYLNCLYKIVFIKLLT